MRSNQQTSRVLIMVNIPQTEPKRPTNWDRPNYIPEHQQQTKHTTDWDPTECISCNTNYKQLVYNLKLNRSTDDRSYRHLTKDLRILKTTESH